MNKSGKLNKVVENKTQKFRNFQLLKKVSQAEVSSRFSPSLTGLGTYFAKSRQNICQVKDVVGMPGGLATPYSLRSRSVSTVQRKLKIKKSLKF